MIAPTHHSITSESPIFQHLIDFFLDFLLMLRVSGQEVQHPRQAARCGVMTLKEERVHLVTDLQIRQSFPSFISSRQQDVQEITVLATRGCVVLVQLIFFLLYINQKYYVVIQAS